MRGLFVLGVLSSILLVGRLPADEPQPEAAAPAATAPKARAEPPARDAKLRKELLRMASTDQQARLKQLELMQKAGTEANARDEKLLAEIDRGQKKIAAMDESHTVKMKAIIEKHGWPARSQVGTDGARAAFFLVQHADKDLAFQKTCAELMEAMPKEEVVGHDAAYLIDRILVAEGKRQKFGSQLQANSQGEVVAYPIEDEATVDDRRRAFGMEPLEEYLEKSRELMKAPRKAGKPVPEAGPERTVKSAAT